MNTKVSELKNHPSYLTDEYFQAASKRIIWKSVYILFPHIHPHIFKIFLIGLSIQVFQSL